MPSDGRALWERYQKYLCVCEPVGVTLDVSRMRFSDDLFERMAAAMNKALEAMEQLEKGAIANLDENRKVGHYWLRAPELAPRAEADAVRDTLRAIKAFTQSVHQGKVVPAGAPRFRHVLVIGIGGSALGPQLVADALGHTTDPMEVVFFDNTDPDGFDRVLARLGDGLPATLTVVISKSGGTQETRNGMLEAEQAYKKRGLDFAKHAVAITGADSDLDRHAQMQGWLQRFPMWDWIGGRTSEMSAVGLLPAMLQGLDTDAMLAGAREMDVCTRERDVRKNPAALMAMMWHHATGGRGQKDLVVLPYKDRLLLLSRYLQQLVMESLGKEKALDGSVVHQGLAVYGNKGSTDQHAYMQQLRDGVENFFVTFIDVLEDRKGGSLQVAEDVTSGDFLMGFWLGTRQALGDGGRESMSLIVRDVSARTLGALIALYERTVGLYASLVNINAYHQPGVEAGKKAAGAVIELQRRSLTQLRREKAKAYTADELATALGVPDQAEMVFHVLEHLAANPERGVRREAGKTPTHAKYRLA